MQRQMCLYIVAFICSILPQAVWAQSTCDSTFLVDAKPIIFTVNKTNIHREDYEWIIDSLIPRLNAVGPQGKIIGRSAASPEGPWRNNIRLAEGRRKAALDFFGKLGVDTARVKIDPIYEDYELLLEMMRLKGDRDYQRVRAMVRKYGTEKDVTNVYSKANALKREMQNADRGVLWRRLLKEYYPLLRGVRIMVYDPLEVMRNDLPMTSDGIMRLAKKRVHLEYLGGMSLPMQTGFRFIPPRLPDYLPVILDRREVVSVKTNLLEWGAYVPQYGWCPMPNFTVEYYPLHGHFTYAFSFDFPWWQGNTTNHKYFQLRNYTPEVRYYVRSGDIGSVGYGNGAAFKGLYFSAYGNVFLYGIGFNKDKGWQGEGFGGGAGIGYTLPISRDGHWRLDFLAQFGYFWSKYDPYVYGCPVEQKEDGLYYYNWVLDADLFRERQYRYQWLGPTRVGVTLSYDILYRRRQKKGVSFRDWEIAPLYLIEKERKEAIDE